MKLNDKDYNAGNIYSAHNLISKKIFENVHQVEIWLKVLQRLTILGTKGRYRRMSCTNHIKIYFKYSVDSCQIKPSSAPGITFQNLVAKIIDRFCH